MAVRKFMFDVSFDAPHPGRGRAKASAKDQNASAEPPASDNDSEGKAGKRAKEPPPPPPSFTEEDLEEARRLAHEEGRESGLREAEATTERVAAKALGVIAARLQTLDQAQAEAAKTAQRHAVELAVGIMRKMLPAFSRRAGTEEIEAVLRECLPLVLDQPRIIIKTPCEVAPLIKDKAEDQLRTAGFEGRLVISGDESLKPGDCQVEWADGGAERDGERLWDEVLEIVERHLHASAPTDDAAPQTPDHPEAESTETTNDPQATRAD